MRTMLASLVLGLALWTTTPAAAQLGLDACLDDPARCIEDTVDETVGEVTGTVDETVDEITGTVDDVVDPGGGGAPSPSGGDPQGSGGSTRAGGPTRDEGGRGSSGTGSSEPVGGARPTAAGRVERSTAPADTPPPPDDPLDAVRQTLSGSTSTLAFPLALILVLGAFLLVQGRLDRSDPKLALAPVDPDHDDLAFG